MSSTVGDSADGSRVTLGSRGLRCRGRSACLRIGGRICSSERKAGMVLRYAALGCRLCWPEAQRAGQRTGAAAWYRSSRNSSWGLAGAPGSLSAMENAVWLCSLSCPPTPVISPSRKIQVSTITAAELCRLRISRVDLRRLFAEAAKLLLGIKPRDQAR